YVLFSVSAVFIPRLETNKPVPVREDSLILSCFPAAVFNTGSITWYNPSGTELSRCYSIAGGICNLNTSSYAFTANSTGSYAFIHSLNRTRDSGLWYCAYPFEGWLNQTVVVFASPVGVKLVPSLSPVVDLGMESLTLKCQTVNCTFPAPNITWYIYNMTSTQISSYAGTSITLESNTSLCTEQEAVYTSTLQLPHGTTFQGNIPVTTKFLCGLEHSTLGHKVEYSQHSSNVTFAAMFIPRLETNKPVPVREDSLILSCFPVTVFTFGVILWYHPNGTELSRCFSFGGGICNLNTSSYAFTANNMGSYAFIHSLNRTRDSGLWQCAYPDIGWLNQTVVVYTSPVGVKLVPSLSPVVDLGMESLTLKCQTVNCTFPAPNITWYIYNMTSTQISTYNGSSSTLESDSSPCTEQEAVYTSTLQLPRGTTFQGNIALTTNFLCGLEHPTLGQKVKYSQQSGNVTFAGPPQIVDAFHFNRFIEKQVEFNFKPGFNGGRNQTFAIEYRTTTIPDSPWMNSSVTDLKETQTYNGTYFVNVSQPPQGTYEYRMYSWNEIGRSPYSVMIAVFIPEVASTSASHGTSVAGIAGGVIAGFVIILVVVIGMLFWRRFQHRRKNEHDKDVINQHKERNQINASYDKQDVASGKEYEGLHFTKAEATQYLQIIDITLEENRNPSIRPPEGDSYEKLHAYTNNDIQMYSSLNIIETSKDSKPKYENSVIK
ncbi:hypothetical protein CHS0354_034053, partial [Potamilus streckersoni]